MINRITQGLINEFQSTFSFTETKESVVFEHFVNYIILEKKLENRLDTDSLEEINIGVNHTFGLDGFCILVNKHLITTKEELTEIIKNSMKPTVEVFFIQAKTSNKFDGKEIGSFGHAVEDFISIEPSCTWSENAKTSIDLFAELTALRDKLESINCFIYYATLGVYKNNQSTETLKNKIIKKIKDQKVFEYVDFYYLDESHINNTYKKIGQKISGTFDFKNRTSIPDIVEEAYIGVVPVHTIIDLIEDENNELIDSVFYDNVRDFQGTDKNKINQAIKNSIFDEEIKLAFSLLNNGITIVAENLTSLRDRVTITNYQIINGLQTSRVLQESKSSLDSKMSVPLKLIITQDEGLISKIIRSTNSQTAVKEEDLLAYSQFQKNLEDYFKSYNKPEEKLYYERRSKQYNHPSFDLKKIIDKATLIKVMGSFYFMKPELATRYYKKLTDEIMEHIFKDDHNFEPYYTAVFIYKKLEESYKDGKIDIKYKKIKYFILMMFRLEYSIKNYPDFGSKTNYYKELLEYIKNSENFNKLLTSVLEKLNTLEIDYSSTEISKSANVTKQCKEKYFKASTN